MSGAMTTSLTSGAVPIPGPLDQPCRYGVYTGIEVEIESADAIPPAARLGLEPPRFCGQCGRRMIVQVRPDGWDARCSRHGRVDSSDLGHR
ncbi:hypothetical protein GPOL_c27300 [Gordonia polyisoprenivorans VH2]|uniref:Biotin synthase auxiliary protein n=2 Tax=Gordonia polyisoprenivorans TaxID=84595 RepID=H6MRU5_GORPV|nr:hypothetical protein GPOL_c27300 [Gordonia polyisoprenivorans VH2]